MDCPSAASKIKKTRKLESGSPGVDRLFSGRKRGEKGARDLLCRLAARTTLGQGGREKKGGKKKRTPMGKGKQTVRSSGKGSPPEKKKKSSSQHWKPAERKRKGGGSARKGGGGKSRAIPTG